MTTQSARAHAAPVSPPSSRGRRVTAALAAGVIGFGLFAAATPAQANGTHFFCPDSTQPYVPVAEVEAFSAGEGVTGLSVTHGTTPDAFTGTYIGYIDDGIGAGKDMLLFKLSSDVIDGTGGLKAAGIWAGMSGSPVSKDGRLIGAVSYSLNYDNLPIAGVTPAEYMKSIGTTAVSTAAQVKLTRSNLKVSAAGIKAAGTDLVGASLSQVKTVNVAGGAGE
ncbi:MAG TPA: SpoIVB peptidase S55 domain-containing protein, partial [Propionicimonas sp.]|nr:SpoIVB peptidase S55 domain-containing protein [Propionicimonas sp.]